MQHKQHEDAAVEPRTVPEGTLSDFLIRAPFATLVALPRGEFKGLWLADAGGADHAWLLDMIRVGYSAEVCADESCAEALLDAYLALPRPAE